MARRKAGGELVEPTPQAPAESTDAQQILQFATDAQIDVTDLQKEFREFPSTLFAYNEAKANGESMYDRAKASYEEAQAEAYIRIKGGETKVTEKHAEALVVVDPLVKEAFHNMLSMKRDLDTFKNYVESLRAKKDMLIQLGADARKE